MKIPAFAAAAVLASTALAAAPEQAAKPAPPSAASAPRAATRTAVIPVKGMSCGGCVEHVNGALGKLKGVRSVNTDLDKERTTVVFDPAQIKPDQLTGAIAEAGYKPGKAEVK